MRTPKRPVKKTKKLSSAAVKSARGGVSVKTGIKASVKYED